MGARSFKVQLQETGKDMKAITKDFYLNTTDEDI